MRSPLLLSRAILQAGNRREILIKVCWTGLCDNMIVFLAGPVQ